MTAKNEDKSTSPALKPNRETLDRFLSLQEQRLALDLKQADIALRELDHNQKLADKSIDAQERDRRHDREETSARQLRTLCFAGIIVFLILVFAGYCIHAGQTALVMDIIKVVVAFAGGMGFQAYRARNDRPDDAE